MQCILKILGPLVLLFYFAEMPVIADSCAPLEPKCFAWSLANEPFDSYVVDMEQRFHRNLPPSFSLDRDVTVRFYLAADGVIRDVQVQRSSQAAQNTDRSIDLILRRRRK
jgi:hypothetical protein